MRAEMRETSAISLFTGEARTKQREPRRKKRETSAISLLYLCPRANHERQNTSREEVNTDYIYIREQIASENTRTENREIPASFLTIKEHIIYIVPQYCFVTVLRLFVSIPLNFLNLNTIIINPFLKKKEHEQRQIKKASERYDSIDRSGIPECGLVCAGADFHKGKSIGWRRLRSLRSCGND
jgi:hypothetical protein